MTRPAPVRRVLALTLTLLVAFGATAEPVDAAISRTSKSGRVGTGPRQTAYVTCNPYENGLYRPATRVGRVPGVRHQSARTRNRIQVWNGARWVRYRVDGWQRGHNVGGGKIYFGQLPSAGLRGGYFRVVMEIEWRGRNRRLGRATFLFGRGQYLNPFFTDYCYLP